MTLSNHTKLALVLLLAGAAALLRTTDSGSNIAFAQDPAPRSQAAPATQPAQEMPVDKYDRNATLWAHQRSGYASGWQRGMELYYMNCWMCHSEYVIAGDHFPASSLRDVSKRLKDEEIAMYIRNGTSRMPAFKQLNDADIKDLLALFKEKCGTLKAGGGCFDEHNPPPNPLYRFEQPR